MRRAEVYGVDLPHWLRMMGCWAKQDGTYRFNWGEVSFGWGLSAGYSVYHDRAHVHAHLIWPNVYIKVPKLIRERPGTEDWMASYGISVYARDVHLKWRTASRIIYLPWDWSHVRHDVFDGHGNRRPWKSPYGSLLGDGSDAADDGRYKERHPYRYTMLSGESQERVATIYGEEMEWRWRWLRRLPWPRKISRTISVEFSDEVGERTGSWKGGVTGCGWGWRHGETMVDALRRMEREREFS